MPVEWTESSGKHDVPREDALYAIANAVGFQELTARAGETRMVYVGHPHPQADRYIEVIVAMRQPRTMVIFHAMPLTDTYRRLIGDK